MNAVSIPDRIDPLPFPFDSVVDLGRLRLEHGQVIEDARLAVSVLGSRGPVYLVLGGISADRRIADHDGHLGWWRTQVAPGGALDPHRCRIVSIDYLGAGDSSRPRELDEYVVTPDDQALAAKAALEALGIPRLDGVIGCSYGGLVALCLARRFPLLANRALVVCAAHRSAVRTSAYRAVQRDIVRLAQAAGRAADGVALARGLAMIGFRSGAELDRRFTGRPDLRARRAVLPVEDYLASRGRRYAAVTDAASFVCLSQSCDLIDLDPADIPVPLWLAGAENDEIVPFTDLVELAAGAPRFQRLETLDSITGHDAFLTETRQVAAVIEAFTGGEDVS